jgi:hypothetical protein
MDARVVVEVVEGGEAVVEPVVLEQHAHLLADALPPARRVLAEDPHLACIAAHQPQEDA